MVYIKGSTYEDDLMGRILRLGKIKSFLLEAEYGKLVTDEIIITDERIRHIKERHPEDFELFKKYGRDCVEEPDYIIKDLKHMGTVFMIKEVEECNLNVIVRIVLEKDNKQLKNSVMTFYRLRNRNLEKLMERNGVLYKRK